MNTNYKRLVTAVIIGYTFLSVALLTPALVLLSVRVINLDPENYTTTFGLCSAFGTVFAIFGPPIGGALGDRTRLAFGRRKTWLVIGGVLGAIGMLLMGLSHSILYVIIGWIIVQFFYNIAGASFAGLMPDQVPVSKRASYSGLIGIVQPLGVLIGMILAALLNKDYPAFLWILLAIMGIAGPVITCLLIRDTPANPVPHAKKSLIRTLSSIYPSPRKYPNYTKAIFLKIFVLMGYGSTAYLTIMLAKRLGMSGDEAGHVVSLINIAALFFTAMMSIVGGILSDKFKKQRPFICMGAIFIIIGLLFDMMATSIPIVVIGSVMVALGFGLFNSSDAALVMRVLPNMDNAGKDVGIMASANNLQGVLIPMLAPMLLGIGSWYAFFGGVSIFVILGIIILYTIPEDPRYKASLEEQTIKEVIVK